MKIKFSIMKIILVLVVLLLVGLACNGNETETPPPDKPEVKPQEPEVTCHAIDLYDACEAWQSQNCKPTVYVVDEPVSMKYQGQEDSLQEDKEYLVLEGATILVNDPGVARIDYGGGNRVTIYPPQVGEAEFEIQHLNGIMQVALNAGAGEVYEDSDTAPCNLTVSAATPDGIIEINSDGTSYLVVVDPEKDEEQVQVAAESGVVTVTAPDGEATLVPEGGEVALVTVTDGQIGEVLMISTDLQELLNNYRLGLPLTLLELPPLEFPPEYDYNVTLTLWNPWTNEPEASILEPIVAAFQQYHPETRFEIQTTEQGALLEKFMVSLAAGNSPVLLIGSSDWIPELYENGVLLPLALQQHESLLKQINPPALDTVLYDGGRLMGLPVQMGGVVLYRNQEIIPAAPTHYADLRAWAKEVYVGANDYYGVVALPNFYFNGGILYGLDGRLMDEEGNPDFYNQAGIDWLNLVQDFNQIGIVSGDAPDIFAGWGAGFIMDGTWNRNRYIDSLGDSLSIDPWPDAMSGFVYAQPIFLNFESNTDENTKLVAREFMAFMLSNTAQRIIAEAGLIPSIMDPGFDDPFLQQMMEALASGVATPFRREMGAYWDPLDTAIQAVLEGSLSPDEALYIAEEEISAGIYEMRGE